MLARPYRVVLIAVLLMVATAASADMLTTLRVGNWNVANRPNSDADAADLESILAHAATLDPGGFGARPFDLLALAETDTGSAPATVDALNAAYSTTTYTASVSPFDGGGDRTGFVYDASRLTLLETSALADGLTHYATRGTFRPSGTDGHADFTAYALHLKAGGSQSDGVIRADEAAAIRADADALGQGTEAIYLGDFNTTGGDELSDATGDSAWEIFAATGAGQAFDPLGTRGAGNYRDDPDLLRYHTQDAGGSMDDRFDYQLLTLELDDDTGLDFAPGAYAVVGNDGSHELNGPITSGTGAPADVLAALARFSDHLPVFMDYHVLAERLPGDANNDGTVSLADFLILRSNFGGPGMFNDGDFNDDGTVSLADFLILRANFGSSDPAAAAVMDPWLATVPEPTALAILGLGGLLLLRRGRRGEVAGQPHSPTA